MNTTKIMRAAVILLGLGALVTGFFFSHKIYQNKREISAFHGTYLEEPRTVSTFELMGTDGRPFNNASLKNQWTLVFFGFTECGSICPTTLAELSTMYRILKEQGVEPLPHVVMVSLDPDRDSLEKLGKYMKSFNPSFYGARGNDSVVKRITKEMGVAYTKVKNPESASPKDYNIQHSGVIMLFNPEGKLNAFFTTPHADFLAADFKLLV